MAGFEVSINGRFWVSTEDVVADPVETPFERHYSAEQLAEVWNLSPDFVRRLFLREPGVVVFHRARPGRRVYRTIRIPESVAARVHRRLTHGG
jgi:hypothetical protein